MLSCRATPPAPPIFEVVAPETSGITFTNRLSPSDSAINIVNYLYYYNGGGVAAGDIDGDGLVDLYFTSNLGSNRLYRNLGNFRFEDITDRAGVADSVGWKSGVTMADVNGDGRFDIYVSGVNYLGMPGRNVLYINNGDGTFTDRVAEYGLAFSGYSTQAAFFDYDVSASVGIYGGAEGFGLGVAVSDVNLDSCPDIYIANEVPANAFTISTTATGRLPNTSRRA